MDLNRVFAALGDAGIRVRSMRTKSNRLEELFVRLTGDRSGGEDGSRRHERDRDDPARDRHRRRSAT